MKFPMGFICFSFLFLTLLLIGLSNLLTSSEPNGCNMTFMYEYPQLVKVALPPGTKNHKKYGLYVYGEGRSIHKVREMKFDGVPVLFIPGNRGSPMQVRSLASVSLSKAQNSRIPFHFDYFAVDLNEDFSALYGGFLKEQTEFVNVCLERIISLYRKELKPKSIILIGHSMGGMIAKGLFLEPNFNSNLVKLVITLAAPHHPALLIDSMLASYYKSVNDFWDKFNTSENSVSFISLGGGHKDVLVRSDLSLTQHAAINVITPTVPAVWLSVDHLALLWCKQLVLTLVRALFDSIDINTKQLNTNYQLRNEIFKYHLINRGGGKSFHTSHFPEKVQLFTFGEGKWIVMDERSLHWEEDRGVRTPTFIILSLATPYDGLAIEAVNHKTKDWVFACTAHSTKNGVKKCTDGINLSSMGRISPPYDSLKRKSVIINLSQLRKQNFNHIVVCTLPTKEPVQLSLDLFRKRDRVIMGTTFLNLRNVLVPKTEDNSSYYSVELPDASRFWHSYRLYVEPLKGCTLKVFGTASIAVPWSNDGVTKILSGNSNSIDFRLLTGKPLDSENTSVGANLFLSPKCSYKISLEKSLVLSLASVVAHSGTSLIAHITCCMLFCLGYQIKCLGSEGNCPLIQMVLPLAAKPYFIIQASFLSATILQSLAKVMTFLPDTDIRLQAGFVELIIIPFFLHLSAFCLTFLLATGVIVTVVLQGQAFNGLFLRFIKRYSLGINWLSEYILTGVNKVPIVVAAFMVTVAFSASGGLALCIGLFFYLFKMISLYEDFWEEIVYWPLRYLKWKLNQRYRGPSSETEDVDRPAFKIPPISEISFHLTLLLLWSIPALFSIPSVLVWAKNYRYSPYLEPDPSFYCAVIMSICVGYLWQSELPKVGLKWSRQLGYILVGLGLVVMIYAQINLYRIPYILCFSFVLITAHQGLMPLLTAAVEIQPSGSDQNSVAICENNQLSDNSVTQGHNLEDKSEEKNMLHQLNEDENSQNNIMENVGKEEKAHQIKG